MSSFASTSLYVGDLPADATEGNLFDIFSRIVQIASIRVCRDVVSRRSLGYAYVNFHTINDAQKAMQELKNVALKGKPLRITWSIRDPSLRKSNDGNIFIKNLSASIDANSLEEIFRTFGTILSSKLATDESGKSKGYAFVHFDSQEAAQEAIAKLNGKLVNDKIVTVTKFLSKNQRDNTSTSRFTNVYVNNLDASFDDSSFKAQFSHFGHITSVFLSQPQNDLNTRYGFINFDNPDDASNAVDAMNGQKVREKVIFVGRAKKKSERQQEIRDKHQKRETKPTVNLYIKNISEEIDSIKLKQLFSPYGELGSVEVMRDEKGNHKGFGFACFMNHEAGHRALSELHGYILVNKPLYIAIAQKKTERTNQRALRFANKQRTVPMPIYPYWQAIPMDPYRIPMTYQPPFNNRGNRPRGNNNRGAGVGRPGYPFVPNQPPQRYREHPVQQTENAVEFSESEKSVHEQLDIASHKLYEMISSLIQDSDRSKKITGMLLDRSMNQGNGLNDLMQLLDNQQLLTSQVSEANNVLQNYPSS